MVGFHVLQGVEEVKLVVPPVRGTDGPSPGSRFVRIAAGTPLGNSLIISLLITGPGSFSSIPALGCRRSTSTPSSTLPGVKRP